MGDHEHFWRLEHLSDRQLLESLQGALRTQRSSLAELIAQLAEVEERRLHLAVACSSLFSYCVQRLGMSEDEACRRIELARLARRFPPLFAELASGGISLSVALLLKPRLTSDNHAELFAAVRGASLRTTRELLAARFPSPDVASRIRKLPQRFVTVTSAGVADAPLPIPATSTCWNTSLPAAMAGGAAAATTNVAAITIPAHAADATTQTRPPFLTSASPAPATPQPEARSLSAVHTRGVLPTPTRLAEPEQAPLPTSPTRHAHQRIDPLSSERYRVQFTADANLKQKLELARDLLRHAHPSGDLAAIVSRALDLLLQDLMQRRFGARRKAARPAAHAATVLPTPTRPSSSRAPAFPVLAATPAPTTAGWSGAAPSPTTLLPPTAPTPAPTSRIARGARRVVLERDGLGCCWLDAAGRRCGSTAWLELDHRHPSGKGGNSAPGNLRLLCRAHNRFAAERAYGRAHVERAIEARQRVAARGASSAQPPRTPALP